MNVDRALVFKSIDAKKQNPQNRPGKFTVKFFPELFLENNKQHFLALDHLSMTASWHNIRPEYENNKLVISKDGGETWETITFPAGIFDYGDINELIHKRIGKTGNQMFFTLFQPRQRQDLCPLKFNPIIICGVKLTQKQSRKSLFWFTDDEDREVNLNDIDISLTVVIKTKNGN